MGSTPGVRGTLPGKRRWGCPTRTNPFTTSCRIVSDCIRLFGGTRLSKYVAEENIGELDEEVRGKGITHQALVNYFEGFSERKHASTNLTDDSPTSTPKKEPRAQQTPTWSACSV